jgi:hypothetical protein
MGKKLIIGFLILILVGGGYWYINQSKGELPPPFIPEGEKAVTLYHKKEGTNTHIYSGFLALATPCEQIETTVSIEKKFPENAIIDVVTKSGSDFCAQVISNKIFSTSFSASEGHTVVLRVNNVPLTTTIIEGDIPTQNETTLPIELE